MISRELQNEERLSGECIFPMQESDLRETVQLERFLRSHQWRIVKTEKVGVGFIVSMRCERCDVDRIVTLVSTGMYRE